jgi:hypothetical protein
VLGCDAEPCVELAVRCKPQHGLRLCLDISRLDKQSFARMLRQVWEISGPPPDYREAERHRLAPDRPVWLARCRKHEYVGCPIKGRDVLPG